jgi:hypothetical protein
MWYTEVAGAFTVATSRNVPNCLDGTWMLPVTVYADLAGGRDSKIRVPKVQE